MYMLMRSMPLRRFLCEQTPAIGLAFIIAELFYKFHSFTLECGAFLVTWYVLDVSIQFVSKQWRLSHTSASDTTGC